MNVALVFPLCIVLASCMLSDSYLVGKKRDPYWAHRPYGRSSSRQAVSNRASYSTSRYPNTIDNSLNEIKLKKFFHGNGNRNNNNFHYQFFNQGGKRGSSEWDYPSMEFIDKVKMPKLPSMSFTPKPTRMNTREWPDYIPPIRMIKLPLDEPPAARN